MLLARREDKDDAGNLVRDPKTGAPITVEFQVDDDEITNTRSVKWIAAAMKTTGWEILRCDWELPMKARYERVVERLIALGFDARLSEVEIPIAKGRTATEYSIKVEYDRAKNARFKAASWCKEWTEMELVVENENGWNDTLRLVRHW